MATLWAASGRAGVRNLSDKGVRNFIGQCGRYSRGMGLTDNDKQPNKDRFLDRLLDAGGLARGEGHSLVYRVPNKESTLDRELKNAGEKPTKVDGPSWFSKYPVWSMFGLMLLLMVAQAALNVLLGKPLFGEPDSGIIEPVFRWGY